MSGDAVVKIHLQASDFGLCANTSEVSQGGVSPIQAKLPYLMLLRYLFLKVLSNDFFIDSDCAHEVSSGPESSTPVLLPNLWHILEYPNRYSALYCTCNFAYCILGGMERTK